MKKLIFKTMLLSGALLASCSDDIMEAPVQEDYAKSFVELFGPVHPDQDWNMAAQKSVTVNPGSANEVRIYASNGNAGYSQVAHFSNVSSTQTFNFVARENVNDFMVSVGSMSKHVKNGGSVDFSNATSRTYINADEDWYSVMPQRRTFSKDYLLQYIKYLPEGEDARNKYDDMYMDFTAVAGEKAVTVYPVYWNAGFYHEFGIYTVEGGARTDSVVIWRNKDSNSDAVLVDWDGDDKGYYSPKSVWTGAKSDNAIIDSKTKVLNVQSEGFTINLPEGTMFGFFIKVYKSNYNKSNHIHTWYSDAKYNKDGQGHAAFFENNWVEEKKDENGNVIQTIEHKQTFLGFEDCQVDPLFDYSANKDVSRFVTDNDYNDLMFVIEPAPTVINHTAEEWILAVEDLGTEDDYDFNDIVVGIKHLAGEETAQFTARAAGGTLPVYLCFAEGEIGGEFHTWFDPNITPDANGLYPMINTSSEGYAATPKTIAVNANFNLSTFTKGTMGGLSIKVGKDGKQYKITPPSPSDAPQMICVPKDWKWPKERTRIDRAYPGFTSWVTENKSTWGNNYESGSWFNNDAMPAVQSLLLWNKTTND